MGEFEVRRAVDEDRTWMGELLAERWGSPQLVSRGRLWQGDRLHAFVAEAAERERIGLATFRLEDDECEMVSLDSLVEGRGVGTALLRAVEDEARRGGCRRLWLITTNDNLAALRFYQKRGLVLVAVHPRAVEASRRLKPSIPEIGIDGIPLRDEIELEVALS
jgi:DNA-3-methyladenine glycosylase I